MYHIITKNEFITSDWAGGKTCQIAILPQGRNYGDRDFDFRISSATVDGEASEFTALPDYNRFLAVLNGEVKLLNETTKQKFKLTPYKIYAFDGSDKITSQGKCTDFNLMVRKNSCCGDLSAIKLFSNSEIISAGEGEEILLFCVEGKINLKYSVHSLPLKADEAIIIKGRNEIIASASKDAVIMLCRMWQMEKTL